VHCGDKVELEAVGGPLPLVHASILEEKINPENLLWIESELNGRFLQTNKGVVIKYYDETATWPSTMVAALRINDTTSFRSFRREYP
jgi:hypothetical protein